MAHHVVDHELHPCAYHAGDASAKVDLLGLAGLPRQEVNAGQVGVGSPCGHCYKVVVAITFCMH